MNNSIPKMPQEWTKVSDIFSNKVDQSSDKSPEWTIGFHGTSLNQIKDQIQKGFIEDKQERFFFGRSPHAVRKYAHAEDPKDSCVIIQVKGPSSSAFIDTLFNTEYFLGFGRKLTILAVYQQTPEFVEASKPENYEKYYPKITDRYYRIYCTALNSIKKYPK